MAVLIEIFRLISSGSKSVVVVPSSTRPRRVTAPAEKRSVSTRDVFPTPPCPTTPTLRILPISIVIRDLQGRSDAVGRCYHICSDGGSVPRPRRRGPRRPPPRPPPRIGRAGGAGARAPVHRAS